MAISDILLNSSLLLLPKKIVTNHEPELLTTKGCSFLSPASAVSHFRENVEELGV